MALAVVRNGWLHFSQLDYGHPVDGAFTIGYRLLDDQGECWSRRFLGAKDGFKPSLDAARAVLSAAIPQLISGYRWDGRDLTFTPAVRSRERIPSPTGPLSILAQHCATQSGGQFAPQLLNKDPHESLHRPPKSVPDRSAILEAANFSAGNVSTPRVIIVDDLITSGLTLSYSAMAMKARNPGIRVYGLALGKHEYLHNLADDLKESPNRHIPAEWDQLWSMHDRG